MWRSGVLAGLAAGLVLPGLVSAQADIQNNYNGAYLEGRSVAEQNLKQAQFYKANLRGVDFSSSDLRGASLFAASLRGANFNKARLDDAELSNADLQGAKLDQAVLAGAYMTAARLKDVSVDGADFTGTIINNQQKTYQCGRATGTNGLTKRQTRRTLGC
ncbi:pentapeptide repeat-containing protein [Gloeobacter violaceus]|uniref:Gll3955 protein n=1 Tax=Gloeobacter violaceus (strain ATCC 29082 / PCC 7421) TaxID=251221 RepID=Q7NEC5_GLOVI|nr:pentapeptide repeat-containing protein [Gloeobacter violaceus]BAC91896.1 gll3955 [Gloeobacter violaceus PCC 7421]